jgi:hypothetical protein
LRPILEAIKQIPKEDPNREELELDIDAFMKIPSVVINSESSFNPADGELLLQKLRDQLRS